MQKPGDSAGPRSDLDQDASRNSLHVQDCLVWAEIHYLDSPTDYREHLPQNRLQLSTQRDDLEMLDASSRFSLAHWDRLPLLAIAFLLILVSAYLVYVVVDGF
jgi:hypothetical protein